VREGLFSDDSITRRINRENVLMLGGGRALLMQLAHPSVAAGVDEHSDFRERPVRRLRRTVRMTMAIVFGDRATALAAARSVNRAHGRVRGEGYHALDPDLLMWVHATLVDSAIVVYDTFVRPLRRRQRDEFYQESKVIGELLGIPQTRFPKTYSDFEVYVDEMLAGPVQVTDQARSLGRLVLRPPLRLLPGPVLIPFEVITAGLLPAALRKQYGLPWGAAQRRVYRLAAGTLPKVVALTPPLLRVWPRPGRTVQLSAAER
jgi:uncharacterized protein (DUF2236 family)